MQVRHYIVKDTGDPAVDRTDVVDRGWGELWIEFSKLDPFLHDLGNPRCAANKYTTNLTKFKWTGPQVDTDRLIPWLALRA